MNDRPVTIFLSAAEASGDEHAAHLVAALRRRLGGARFVGIGGEKMAAAGCEIVADLTAKAGMLGAPILRLGYYIRTVKRIQKAIRKIRPDVHIPVDSPALNWHLAATARRSGATVVYYIAPQVWAWAPWRVRKLARLTDHVACILPFEQRYLRDRGVKATYVGHPLFDSLPPRPSQLPDLAEAWYEGSWRVALLPGSRLGEIAGQAPALLKVAQRICRRWSASRCTFLAHNEEAALNILKACKEQLPEQVDVVVGKTREMLSQSHFAVAASGTVTLEVAHFGVPMVVFYRVGRLAYGLVGRWLVRMPRLSLVNILAGRKIVPELMPWHGSARLLQDTVLEIMNDIGALFEARRSLLELVEPLRAGPPAGTASDNAAEIILEALSRRGS